MSDGDWYYCLCAWVGCKELCQVSRFMSSLTVAIWKEKSEHQEEQQQQQATQGKVKVRSGQARQGKAARQDGSQADGSWVHGRLEHGWEGGKGEGKGGHAGSGFHRSMREEKSNGSEKNRARARASSFLETV